MRRIVTLSVLLSAFLASCAGSRNLLDQINDELDQLMKQLAELKDLATYSSTLPWSSAAVTSYTTTSYTSYTTSTRSGKDMDELYQKFTDLMNSLKDSEDEDSEDEEEYDDDDEEYGDYDGYESYWNWYDSTTQSAEEQLEEIKESEDLEEVDTESDHRQFEVMTDEGAEEVIIDEETEVLENSDGDDEVFVIEDTITVLNETNNQTISSQRMEKVIQLKQDFEKPECDDENPCGEDEFCSDAGVFSKCEPRSKLGEKCYDSRECISGTVCFYGMCSDSVSPRDTGAHCTDQEGCRDSHCCMYYNNFQANFCTPLPAFGQPCLAETDMFIQTDMMMFEVQGCTRCDRGLHCDMLSQMCFKESSDV